MLSVTLNKQAKKKRKMEKDALNVVKCNIFSVHFYQTYYIFPIFLYTYEFTWGRNLKDTENVVPES